MKENTLNKLVLESFKVYQTSLHGYFIKGFTTTGEQCWIEKQEGNKWLLISDEVPKLTLNTKTLREILKSANIMII